MKNREIPVFFSIDDGYAPFLAVAVDSLIKNSSKDRNYRIIVLYQNVSEENISKICSLAKGQDNVKIDFVMMESGMEKITDRMSNRLRCDYFTLTIYFRLFIPAMFPQYDKGIYIDSDVVISGDIAELYDIELGDNYIGACNDLSVADVPELVRYMENAVGVKKEEYINSGVLLMNLAALREAKLDEHFLSLLSEYHFDCIAPDQDYLNALCNGKIYYLDEKFDAMPNDNKPPLEDTVIIHYNLFSKPWCYDGIQYGDIFWKYAEESGYIEEIKRYKDGYSDEQKRSDSDCLTLLISRGGSIENDDVTFKKMYESGVKIRL